MEFESLNEFENLNSEEEETVLFYDLVPAFGATGMDIKCIETLLFSTCKPTGNNKPLSSTTQFAIP